MCRLFTFVISLVVVGAALVVATRLALSEAPEVIQPATSESGRGRAVRTPAFSLAEEVGAPTLWPRVRAAIALVALLTVLGAIAALLLLIGGAVLLTGLKNAVQ